MSERMLLEFFAGMMPYETHPECTHPFGVPVYDGDELRVTQFDSVVDAVCFAQSCLHADRVMFFWPDGQWRTCWRDGVIKMTRPGFGVHVPYNAGDRQ